MKNIAAFFDIDGTLYREGLITEMFKKLIKYEIIQPEKWYNEVRPEFLKWDKREGDYDSYLLKMIDIYIEAIRGIKKEHIEFIASKVIEQKGERVYTFSRDRIKWHKDQGHILLTISGSPIELVSEMANKYGFDNYRGSIYKVDDMNKYTGEVYPMWDSYNKNRAISEFIEKYDIDICKSYAYGDTSGDFSMFKAVKNPFAINPTKELLNKIHNDIDVMKKINIIIERKDVIYSLEPNKFQIL
ncbi:HAD-superfamily subfamily IB hydrolase, TIGR01490 [Clostridium cavendishii DSM 21758]|uniref:phosphoserine phosphatase n=1 Tax=Clostridium cavendishii DSM 21758 TaxID=1121302 RepID=A0A1M6FGI3_9CLOT|nr:HAD-IB family hydrolase [Clostridium cavendishii]SHI96749.1 HAD-superfamily subfamily IB hydrolase, TIGR01490 [Clostridium cavendishii DSM 21758]